MAPGPPQAGTIRRPPGSGSRVDGSLPASWSESGSAPVARLTLGRLAARLHLDRELLARDLNAPLSAVACRRLCAARAADDYRQAGVPAREQVIQDRVR